MNNLLLKELKLSVNPFFYTMPFLTGALILIPGWLYFLVPLYFCFITIPNMFAGYKTQNDLMFTSMLPVSKKDIVKARILMIVILELMHIIIAMIYSQIHFELYPNLLYIFFKPTIGFWGLAFVMLGLFNLTFISIYFKTAYKYGMATIVSITVAIVFAGGAEWLGIKNSVISESLKGAVGTNHPTLQLFIFITGVVIFALFTIITYFIAIKRFEKVEL